jgi:hypothetical protein
MNSLLQCIGPPSGRLPPYSPSELARTRGRRESADARRTPCAEAPDLAYHPVPPPVRHRALLSNDQCSSRAYRSCLDQQSPRRCDHRSRLSQARRALSHQSLEDRGRRFPLRRCREFVCTPEDRKSRDPTDRLRTTPLGCSRLIGLAETGFHMQEGQIVEEVGRLFSSFFLFALEPLIPQKRLTQFSTLRKRLSCLMSKE